MRFTLKLNYHLRLDEVHASTYICYGVYLPQVVSLQAPLGCHLLSTNHQKLEGTTTLKIFLGWLPTLWLMASTQTLHDLTKLSWWSWIISCMISFTKDVWSSSPYNQRLATVASSTGRTSYHSMVQACQRRLSTKVKGTHDSSIQHSKSK